MIPNEPNKKGGSEGRKKNRRQVILRLLGYMMRHRWMALGAIALTVTGNLLALLGPMLSGYAIDAIGTGPGEADFQRIFSYCALMLLFYLISSVMAYLLSAMPPPRPSSMT